MLLSTVLMMATLATATTMSILNYLTLDGVANRIPNETIFMAKLANNVKPIASFLASEVMDLNGSAMSRRTARVFSHHRGSGVLSRPEALSSASAGVG
jgi:hypothetical protein